MIKMNWYEEVKQDFIKNISDSYTLNLAISVLEDRKTSLDENLKLQNNWNELNKLIDERIGDCRYFLANADVNYEKENMKKFMWLKEELQILKSKVQELEQGKDE